MLLDVQKRAGDADWSSLPFEITLPDSLIAALPPAPVDPTIRMSPRSVANRLFDIATAFTGLVILAPLMLVIAVIVSFDTGGIPIFRHSRIGRFGVPFYCLKFRTMVVDADRVLAEHLANDSAARHEWALDFKLRRDPRITRLGRFLRRTSLDELPQLLNILVGNMSLVGPRPIVEAEVARYGLFFGDYCSVRPGLTGLWQISGRNDMSYPERVMLDSQYARTKSLRRDLVILSRTGVAVMLAQGSY